MHSLEIAQRFNAGSRLRESSKSLRGRQNRGDWLALLSSLEGLPHFCQIIVRVPQARDWAIFGSTEERERDSLRIGS